MAWWAGLTITDARAGLERVKPGLESDEVGGRAFWFAESGSGRAGSREAYLLPAWDEVTVAYRDRRDILDPKYAARVNSGGGILSPVIVVRGEVVGTWKRTVKKDTVTVKPTFFKGLGRTDREAVVKAVDRYARFLGLSNGVLTK